VRTVEEGCGKRSRGNSESTGAISENAARRFRRVDSTYDQRLRLAVSDNAGFTIRHTLEQLSLQFTALLLGGAVLALSSDSDGRAVRSSRYCQSNQVDNRGCSLWSEYTNGTHSRHCESVSGMCILFSRAWRFLCSSDRRHFRENILSGYEECQ